MTIHDSSRAHIKTLKPWREEGERTVAGAGIAATVVDGASVVVVDNGSTTAGVIISVCAAAVVVVGDVSEHLAAWSGDAQGMNMSVYQRKKKAADNLNSTRARRCQGTAIF